MQLGDCASKIPFEPYVEATTTLEVTFWKSYRVFWLFAEHFADL
jgi:hypothetical protein